MREPAPESTTAAQPATSHTNMPTVVADHIVKPSVSLKKRGVDGVALAIENTAAHSSRASSAPAVMSARRRRSARAAASSSQPRMRAVETLASVLAERRTSNLRSKGFAGRISHQGVTPTVRTTARAPTLAP